MLKYAPVILCVAVLLLGALPTVAETKFTFDGQMRIRGEIDGRYFFEPDTITTRSFSLLRTRVGINAEIHERASAYVQIQDSRVLGGTNEDGLPTSGTLNDGENIDLHQGYLLLKDLLFDGLNARAGRFEFILGNQRVFGAVGWSNVGRSWDGAELWWENDRVQLKGFLLKRLEVDSPDGNRDYDVAGANVALKESGVQFLAVYEYDGDGETINNDFVNDLDRFSFGGYLAHKYDRVDVIANAVYQLGTVLDGGTELDIGAYLLTGELGISFEDSPLKRLAGGFDIVSGDDSPNDSDWSAYNNLFYTGHKFRGFMDYFVASGTAGLIDLYVRGDFALFEDWTLRGDLHHFSSAADRIYDGDTVKDLGWEIDMTLKKPFVPGVVFQFGASLFLPDESFAGMDDPDKGFWLYSQATAGF
jgi:hypothetical protein